jgi:hypothetical protein
LLGWGIEGKKYGAAGGDRAYLLAVSGQENIILVLGKYVYILPENLIGLLYFVRCHNNHVLCRSDVELFYIYIYIYHIVVQSGDSGTFRR